jgi:hypothetical protein
MKYECICSYICQGLQIRKSFEEVVTHPERRHGRGLEGWAT